MCGLTAIISSSEISRNTLKGMNDHIIHRGPDGEGYSHFQSSSLNVAFGHRRLAIHDLSPDGLQPFRYLDYEIIFNGEVYNFLELREQLESHGYSFRTKTDTEVLVAAYAFWGKQCLNYFNGMYSFLILDKKQSKVFGARDRFGIKPLYYFKKDDCIAFASEIKQFFALDNFSSELNHQAAYDYLLFGITDHRNETFFKNVFQVPQGHSFEVSLLKPLSTLKTEAYYHLQKNKISVEDNRWAPQFLSLMRESISLQLRSDVKVGSCLSGGLDSTTIVTLVNESLRTVNKADLQETFSSCSEDKRFDERLYIKSVEDMISMNNHKVFPSADRLFLDLDKLIYSQDEPFISTSIFAQNEVFGLAKKNDVTVMLDGQGADEILGGYHTFFKPLLFSYFSSLKIISFISEALALKKIHGLGLIHVFKAVAVRLLPEFLVEGLRRLTGAEALEHPFFNFEIEKIELRNPKSYNELKINDVNDFSLYLTTSGNLPMLLRYEDRNSMAHSIEARVPFLDHNVVEFALSLPNRWKIYRGVTKTILRVSMEKIIPKVVSDRKDKMGFVTAEEVWFAETEPDKFMQLIRESVKLSHGLVSEKIIQEAQSFVEGKRSYDFRFWRAICFAQWLNRFKVKI